MFFLAGALAAAAAILFIMLWNEGETAEKNAQALLEQSGIEPSVSYTVSSTDPAVSSGTIPISEPESTFETELEGYTVIARLDIDKIDAHLPVLAEMSRSALKVSVCYYSGAAVGEDGNMIITGHNYASGAHFGTLDQLAVGDTVYLTDTDNTTYTYTVYQIEHIDPDDAESLDDTEYARELTLLTCESKGNGRLLVRCRFTEEQE